VQPGAYFYQFLVDGRWSVSGNSSVEPDEQGHLSNKVLCTDFGCCGGQHAKRCLARSLRATRELNACEAQGVHDMQHQCLYQLMHTRPPVLTAFHSAYMHLTSSQAFAQMHSQSACTDLQLKSASNAGCCPCTSSLSPVLW